MSIKRRSGHETPLVTELRAAIEDAKVNAYALAKKAGIDEASVRKFVSRERSLSVDSAGRLADALGLKVIRAAKPRKFAGEEPAPKPARERERPPAIANRGRSSDSGLDYAETGPPASEEQAGSIGHLVPAPSAPEGHQADVEGST